MSRQEPSAGGRWLRLAAGGAIGAVAAGLLGYFPTLRMAGREAIGALAAGCGVALAAGWIGAVPIAMSGSVKEQLNRFLASTALRMGAGVLLGTSVALAGWFPLKPLLVWLAIGYMAALAGETTVLVSMMRSRITRAIQPPTDTGHHA